MSNISIAIDAMGGDQGPKVTVPAALLALRDNTQLHLVLVGDEKLLEQQLCMQKTSWDKSRLTIRHASQVVAMDEQPAFALRNKKDSSMRVALNMVHDGTVQACVSAGNTGALMATARFVLKMLPGVDRPAILFPVPSQHGEVYMLDLGANVECTAEHLFQFAVMGSVLASAITIHQNSDYKPKVGLLNVGSEDIKGTAAIKQAAIMLQNTPDINYIGYVEGDDIYLSDVDVIVCDGFVGNVALKASEGLARMIFNTVSQEFKRNLFTKFLGFVCLPVLKRLRSKFDTDSYNGGSLLGLKGVVLKSHGGANIYAFVSAINKAVKEVETNVPEKIRASVASKLGDVAAS